MSKLIRILPYLCIFLFFGGCSTDTLMKKEGSSIDKEISQVTPLVPREIPQAKPPVVEVKPNPLADKTITLTANNASFTDIFSAVADIAGLDLVIDSRLVTEGTSLSGQVRQAAATSSQSQSSGGSLSNNAPIGIRPVNVAFSRTPLEEALRNLSESLNIFSEVRGKCLYVKGTDSKTYHLNFVSSQKETKMSLGGDVLNGGTGGGGGSSTSPLSGQFSIQSTTPSASNDIYTQVEQIVQSSLSDHGSYSLNRAIGFLEVSDRKNTIARIDSYIKTLKTYYNSQVVITAKILEVSLNDSSKYGIDWSSIHGTIGDYAFNPIQQNLTFSSDSLTPALEIKVGSTKHGIDAALEALQEFGTIKVLSNPRIRVTNGQPALISVGTNSSYVQKVEKTTTITDGRTEEDIEVTISAVFDGIMLGVQPYIDLETNDVNLTITPIKSRVVKLDERRIGSFGDVGTFTLPTIDLKEATTQLRVKSGNVVALGGLISKGTSDQTKSIPILGDIPIFGYLFSQKTMNVETEELVILLEPVIVEQ